MFSNGAANEASVHSKSSGARNDDIELRSAAVTFHAQSCRTTIKKSNRQLQQLARRTDLRGRVSSWNLQAIATYLLPNSHSKYNTTALSFAPLSCYVEGVEGVGGKEENGGCWAQSRQVYSRRKLHSESKNVA